MAFAENGIRVIGMDKDARKVDMLKKGKSYMEDIPDEGLKRNLKYFHPTTDFSLLPEVEAVIICVQTPLSKTKDPDISYIFPLPVRCLNTFIQG